jgi:AcrR family transcriptional regulator
MSFVEGMVDAAVRVAAATGREVGALSLAEIAAAAGVSRSTLLRRAGGRAAVDAALRERVRAPVSLADRVVAAAASVIGADGVAGLTLERVAERAGCTVMSLYNLVGGRDALLVEVFRRHTVLPELAPRLRIAGGATVAGMALAAYRTLIDVGLDRSSVATALMTDALARPGSALAEHVRTAYLPHARRVVEEFFDELVARGAVRDERRDALLALFLGPVQIYLEIATLDRRPRGPAERGAVAAALAEGFTRAVTPTPSPEVPCTPTS